MDWSQVIAELSGYGLTQPQIAHLCGCEQSTISSILTGKTKDPRYTLGRSLEALLMKERRKAARREKIAGKNPAHRSAPATSHSAHNE